MYPTPKKLLRRNLGRDRGSRERCSKHPFGHVFPSLERHHRGLVDDADGEAPEGPGLAPRMRVPGRVVVRRFQHISASTSRPLGIFSGSRAARR